MKVRAKETIPLGVRTIVKGTVLDLPDGTASRLEREGRVEILTRPPKFKRKRAVPQEDKAVKNAPKDKAIKTPAENKTVFAPLPEFDSSIERESVPLAEGETVCPFCGEVKKISGLASHIRIKHSEQYKAWKES